MKPEITAGSNGEYRYGYQNTLIFTILVLILFCIFLLDIMMGSVSIKPADIFNALFNNSDPDIKTIILKFRLPKAVTALASGIALSLSGLQMQTIFRNPMAGPYVLGVSSGASLGVAVIILGFSSKFIPGNIQGFGNWALIFSAWLGAGAVLLLIM